MSEQQNVQLLATPKSSKNLARTTSQFADYLQRRMELFGQSPQPDRAAAAARAQARLLHRRQLAINNMLQTQKIKSLQNKVSHQMEGTPYLAYTNAQWQFKSCFYHNDSGQSWIPGSNFTLEDREFTTAKSKTRPVKKLSKDEMRSHVIGNVRKWKKDPKDNKNKEGEQDQRTASPPIMPNSSDTKYEASQAQRHGFTAAPAVGRKSTAAALRREEDQPCSDEELQSRLSDHFQQLVSLQEYLAKKNNVLLAYKKDIEHPDFRRKVMKRDYEWAHKHRSMQWENGIPTHSDFDAAKKRMSVAPSPQTPLGALKNDQIDRFDSRLGFKNNYASAFSLPNFSPPLGKAPNSPKQNSRFSSYVQQNRETAIVTATNTTTTTTTKQNFFFHPGHTVAWKSHLHNRRNKSTATILQGALSSQASPKHVSRDEVTPSANSSTLIAVARKSFSSAAFAYAGYRTQQHSQPYHTDKAFFTKLKVKKSQKNNSQQEKDTEVHLLPQNPSSPPSLAVQAARKFAQRAVQACLGHSECHTLITDFLQMEVQRFEVYLKGCLESSVEQSGTWGRWSFFKLPEKVIEVLQATLASTPFEYAVDIEVLEKTLQKLRATNLLEEVGGLKQVRRVLSALREEVQIQHQNLDLQIDESLVQGIAACLKDSAGASFPFEVQVSNLDFFLVKLALWRALLQRCSFPKDTAWKVLCRYEQSRNKVAARAELVHDTLLITLRSTTLLGYFRSEPPVQLIADFILGTLDSITFLKRLKGYLRTALDCDFLTYLYCSCDQYLEVHCPDSPALRMDFAYRCEVLAKRLSFGKRLQDYIPDTAAFLQALHEWIVKIQYYNPLDNELLKQDVEKLDILEFFFYFYLSEYEVFSFYDLQIARPFYSASDELFEFWLSGIDSVLKSMHPPERAAELTHAVKQLHECFFYEKIWAQTLQQRQQKRWNTQLHLDEQKRRQHLLLERRLQHYLQNLNVHVTGFVRRALTDFSAESTGGEIPSWQGDAEL